MMRPEQITHTSAQYLFCESIRRLKLNGRKLSYPSIARGIRASKGTIERYGAGANAPSAEMILRLALRYRGEFLNPVLAPLGLAVHEIAPEKPSPDQTEFLLSDLKREFSRHRMDDGKVDDEEMQEMEPQVNAALNALAAHQHHGNVHRVEQKEASGKNKK